MPIIAAQQFTAAQLQGMQPPGATGVKAISALITPLTPDVNPDGIARVYVWPANAPEKRRAVPRNSGKNTPAGWKQILHELQIFLIWDDYADDPQSDSNFPLLIDFVMDNLRTCPSPAAWTDPDTGRVSDMCNLGEVMSYDYVPPRTIEGDLMKRYDARIKCSLLELFQA